MDDKHSEPVSCWSIDKVISEICHRSAQFRVKPLLDLAALEAALRANDIDGESVLELKDENIKEDLGITSFGQRREVLKIITQLQERSIRPSSTASKRTLDADLTTATTDQRQKKRRIEPGNIYTTPITVTEAGTDVRHEELEDHWKDLLQRYPDEDDGEIAALDDDSNEDLRPSTNDTRYHAEMTYESESSDALEHEEQEKALPRHEVDAIIDMAIADIKQKWIAQKQHTRYRKALQHWTSAVKAGTRRPAQRFIQNELRALQARLGRIRKYVVDEKLSQRDDVKQACLNMEATVEDCAEREYYLQVLEAQHQPTAPPQLTQDSAAMALKSKSKETHLSADEEIIDSAEERSLDEDGMESSDDADSRRSFSDRSLPFDLLDDDWHPVIAVQPQERLITTDVTTEDFDFVYDDVATVNSHSLPGKLDMQMQTSESSSLFSRPSEDEAEDEVSEIQISPPTAPGQLASQKKPLPSLSHHVSMTMAVPDQHLNTTDSRLPANRYGIQGQTRESAIDLSDSPVGSYTNGSGTEDMIKTPPLNPILKTDPDANIPTISGSQQPLRLRTIWSSGYKSNNKQSETPEASQPRDVALQQDFRRYKFPTIGEMRRAKWREVRTPELSLCKVVYGMDRENYVRPLLNFIKYIDKQKIFLPSLITNTISAVSEEFEDVDGIPAKHTEAAKLYAFCFVCYTSCRGFNRSLDNVSEKYWDIAFEKASVKAQMFHDYFTPLLEFYMLSKSQNDLDTPTKEPLCFESGLRSESTEVSTDIDELDSVDSEADADEDAVLPSRRRKRPVQESQEAKEMQRDDRQRVESQEERRQLLMARFQAHAVAGEQVEVPINTTNPTVFLDPHIASRVKPHQIRGIQFLWRELVDDPKQQGCLLAHTMGLGKTMQVISLLVTIAQCVAHHSPEVQGLIPEHLRSGKVLILCPATLVENWFDELLMWCREPQQLGQIFKVSGNNRKRKVQTVYDWSNNSGVLLTGYETFRSLLDKTKMRTSDELARLEAALLQQPAIVVADEAHKLKNSKSILAQISRRFHTNSRIALTGSPLNNHLEEYHTMIDWIAPGYLGNIKQFRAKYIEIINRGLYSESTRYEKRKSLEKLYVLKRDLAPKINRADISAISAEMPHKVEFYLTVPLTQVQHDIYSLLIQHLQNEISYLKRGSSKYQQTELWKWLSILSWLCNHPSALLSVLMHKEDTDIQTARAQYRSFSPVEGGMEEALAQDLDVSNSDWVGLVPQIVKILDQANVKHRHDPSLSVRADMTRCLIEEATAQGDKTLLFSHSIPTLDYLETILREMGSPFMRIDGSTKVETRQHITKAFNDDEGSCNVFLISTRAGGLGLNLQGANRVIIFDFGFNPSWEEQAIGRAYRLGQKKPVYVYRFKAGGTFEDALYNKNVFKTQLFSRVIDQKNVIRHASRNVEDYLFYPREVEQTNFSDCRGKDAVLDRILQTKPGFVRKVILTETFHTEDEEDELTKEEQELADREVELERLARADPAEYNRRKDAEMRQIQMARSWREDRAPGFEENFSDKLADGVGRLLPDRSKLFLQNGTKITPTSAASRPRALDDSVVGLISRKDQATANNAAASTMNEREDGKCRTQ